MIKRLFLFLLLSACTFGQTCPPVGVAPKITSATSVAFVEGTPVNFAVTATGTAPVVVTVAGALPSGVSFNGSAFVGTATPSGVFPLSIKAHNATAPDYVQQFVFTVNAIPTGGLWIPPVKLPWMWQIGEVPSVSSLLSVGVYDIDGEDASVALVTAIHNKGAKAICYISAGTYENFRDDKGSFPPQVLGKQNGWPGEQWLDIRNLGVLQPIMSARMQMCKDKGFDALEPDNIDGYTNTTGFPLTAADQLTYNKWLADTAHTFGLSVALKNDGEQVKDLVSYFDFDINEQCEEFSECDNLTPFTTAGKAVFEAEYKTRIQANACSDLNKRNFNGAFFTEDLDGKHTFCR